MTVATTERKQSFATNGVTVDFPFTFKATDANQIYCQYTPDGGNTVDYTNFTVVLQEAGGTVTTNDVLGSGTLLVYRIVPLTQNTDYVEGGRFPAESHEAALDKLTLIDQDQQEDISRALKGPIGKDNPYTLAETLAEDELLIMQTNEIKSSGTTIADLNNAIDNANNAAQNAEKVLINLPSGQWEAGIEFNSANEFMNFNGVGYTPLPTTTFPYVTQGDDPTQAPDNAFVQPFSNVNSSNISTYTDLVFDSAADAVQGVISGDAILGAKLRVDDYYGGASTSNSGVLFFEVVAGGTGTADGFEYIDAGSLQLKQVIGGDVNAKKAGADNSQTNLSKVQAAINYASDKDVGITASGDSVICESVPTNEYGTPFKDGALLVPSKISGFNTQYNTYADDANGLMVARENMAAWWLSLTETPTPTIQSIYLYGDSTVENGPAFPKKSNDLFKMALDSAGINGVNVINRGVSGTSWSNLNPTADLGTGTKLIVIKYGINDAVKANALETLASDARQKLTDIRNNANGSFEDLSILLMGPNSTYRPSVGQDSKWYEKLRNIYVQLCKEFNCAYFDTYAYLQDTSNAPGMWLDNIGGSGEGIHPNPDAVWWIWYEGIKRFVLGDGEFNQLKSNRFYNHSNIITQGDVSLNPDEYHRGITLHSCLISNGWPLNGQLITVRNADGFSVQTIYSQDAIPKTMSRRGSGSLWTAFTGQLTEITSFLNGWANAGSARQNAGYKINDDGTVTLYGSVSGGTANVAIFTLPANIAPTSTQDFQSTKGAVITVQTNGNVTSSVSDSAVSLNGLTYTA